MNQSDLANDVTICMVNYRSPEIVCANFDWIESFEIPVQWIFVDNSNDLPESLSAKKNTKVFPAVDRPTEIDLPPGTNNKRLGSLHHAMAINKSVQSVTTKFALVLDPDFIILQPNAIQDVISHLVKNEIAIAGVPWHPRWFYQHRYFPAPQCVFLNLERLPANEVDFKPNYEVPPQRKTPLVLKVLNKIPVLKKHANVMVRSGIGVGNDTGSLLAKRVQELELKSEAFTPVFVPEKCFLRNDDYIAQTPNIEYVTSFLSNAIEFCLPDDWRFIPSKPNSFRRDSMSKSGLSDFLSAGWEEFFWQDRPWGIHQRSYPKRSSGIESNSLTDDFQKAIDVLKTDRNE